MRLGRVLSLVAALGSLAAGAAWADEVIHFKNGTYLTIRSHEIKDDMVHVVLGSDSSVAFPMSLVDRIETGARSSRSGQMANQAVGGPPQAESAVSLSSAPPLRGGGGGGGGGGGQGGGAPVGENPAETHVGMMGVPQARPVGGSGEMAVGRPFATSLDPKKREIGVVGDRSLLQGGAAGTHTTINSGDAQRAFTPNRIRPKGLTPTLPPPEPSQDGQGSAPPEEAAPEAAPTGDGSSEAGGEN